MIYYVLISYILIRDVLKFAKNEVIHEIRNLFHRILRYIYTYKYIYIYCYYNDKTFGDMNRAYFTKIPTNYIDLTMKLILFDDSHSHLIVLLLRVGRD